jgi:hypothetical protein
MSPGPVHLGSFFESDVASYEEDQASSPAPSGSEDGGVETTVWAPPRLTLEVATDLPEQDEYEVRVYDTWRKRRLVAAVELVSQRRK